MIARTRLKAAAASAVMTALLLVLSISAPARAEAPAAEQRVLQKARAGAGDTDNVVFMFRDDVCRVSSKIKPDTANLQGVWTGVSGTDSLTLKFMGNVCGLILNGREMYGMWTLTDNQLNMLFPNGKKLSYSVALQCDNLILDGSVQLAPVQNLADAAAGRPEVNPASALP